ncbi:MAG: PAS domain S-box protein, partial [Isosphaeraceae bacterium]
MWGWNSLPRSGSGIAVVGAVLALALGWPLSSFLGPHVLYLAYFVSALVVTRIGGGSGAFCVLILGSCAGLFRSLPSPSAMTTDPAWEAWTLLLYYGAGVASIVVIDSARRSRPSSGPHLANRPHRQTESTLADDAIPPRVFLEQSRDGIHILDRNGKLRGANRKYEEMLGYSHSEIKNLHVWDWDAQRTREEILEGIRGSDSGGALVETRHRRKDGVVIDVEISTSRVEWREQLLYYCVSRDSSERKQAEQALRESEERFRVLVEQAADAFFVLDENGRFVDVNRRACEILGYSRPELLEMRVVDVVQEIDREDVGGVLSRVESGRAFTTHANARRKDGTCFPMEVRLSRYTIQGQQLFLALVCDITERGAREREIERLNRLYATLSAVSRAIVGVRTREDLFREICRITVEHVGFKVVWMGWHDPKTHAVMPSASAGDHEGYLDGIKIYADDRPEGLGPVGVCVRTGKPCVIYDFVNDPRMNLWRGRAIAHGIRSVAALPLRLGGEICGVFVVYAGEKDVFQDREVSLLQEIADSISFAMDHLDLEEKRRQAEESLLHREAQYRAVIETSADGFWMTNVEGRILEVNDAYVRRSGYRREELEGMHISALEAKEQPAETAARILKIRQNGTDLYESLHRARDGTVWPVEVNAAYWPSAEGRTMVFLRDITGRKQAEEALVERARLAALGADIGIALTRGDTMREILRSCSEAIVQHIDAAFARIWTLNPQQDVLELQASAGMYTHIDGPHGRVPVGHLKVGLIAQERRPHLTNAVIGDPRVGNQEWAQREGMVSFAGYPLVVKDRIVGVMALFARRPLTHATLQAMASVADEIALGIEQKRAEEALRDSEAKLQAIVNTAV